ncbi:MAG TPA: hypothetical protein VNG53_11650 [Bacteroidia bacterium]|nr:hypothetical protein [Bacteroidia bacterium]
MELPRRQLTVESSDLLWATLVAILTEILKESCPCHYPRYRELTTFLHDNYNAGPVFCADTNYLIACSTKKELNYLTEIKKIRTKDLGDYDDIIYCCNKCATTYRQVTRQYSINFEFSYFIIEEKQFGKDVGEKVVKPFPLLQGLFGFDDSEILKCSKDFTLKNSL